MDGFVYWTGAGGRVFASSLCGMLLLAMLFMSIRLYTSRRKKAYFSLTVSLSFILLQQLLTIAFAAAGLPERGNSAVTYLAPLLQMMSFVLLNMGIYQLYNPSRKRHYVLFYGLLALGLALSLLRFLWPSPLPDRPNPLGNIALDLYLFLLLLGCYVRIVPRIGQGGKYEFALLVYFLAHSAHVVNEYVFAGSQELLSTIDLSFPVLFYLLLFILLFERVVELMQAIYESSITDTLTGLYNRRYFMRSVEHYLRSGQPVSVIFSDIDNFKKLNDTQGHQKGDEALKKVAALFMETCREIGVCGRYGGEEMVVLVTDPDVHTGELAEELRARVEAEAGVTVSVGYAKSRRGMDAHLLLKQADEAMYAAKTTGKNKVVSFSKSKTAAST